MQAAFAEVRWAVPGLVPEGLSILAGRQKLGKSWLALDLAISVATGGAALGDVPCDQGDVLYIDLENGERRIQRRIRQLFPVEETRPRMDRLLWATESPMLGPDFIEALDDWRLSVTQPKLVVVDVLQRIKPAGAASRNAYENDYAALTSLQKWATTEGIAVLVIHHTRKAASDDPLESLSGSNGLSACADATMVLNRDTSGNATLYVRGRDVEEREAAMHFHEGQWRITGDAGEVRRTGARGAILQTLEDAVEPMTPSEIASALGTPVNNVKQLLFKMQRAGEAKKLLGRGKYVHPDRASVIDAGTDNQRRTVRRAVTTEGPPITEAITKPVTWPPEAGSFPSEDDLSDHCDDDDLTRIDNRDNPVTKRRFDA